MSARRWYILLLIAAAVLYLWSNVQPALLLLVLMLISAPLAVLENYLVSRKLYIEAALEQSRYADAAEGTGQSAASETEENAVSGALMMTVRVKNNSILPAFRIETEASVKNRLTGSGYQLPFELSTGPKGTSERRVLLESLYCGRIEGEVADTYSYDFLGLSRRRLSVKNRGGCYSYPQAEELTAEDISRHRQDELNTQERYTHKKGNDITEILNIRDYQKGDNIKTIHWKLSKKLGHKVVKELDMPASQDVILLMALSHEHTEDEELRHKVAQMTLNLSELLLKEQIFYDAVLLRDGGSTAGLYTVQEQKTRDWYEQLLLDGNVEWDQDQVEKYIAYHHVFGKYASVVLVTDRELEGWFDEHPQVIQFVV